MTAAQAADATDHDATYVFPASFAQQRLWIIDQLEPGLGTYNVPLQYTLTGSLDTKAVEASISSLIERHEVLRTVFETNESGELFQVIGPPRSVSIEMVDNFTAEPAQIFEWCQREANRPFDLQRGPLIRVSLLRTAVEVHVLSIIVHHIAFDGWSVNILQRELGELYNASAKDRQPLLPELLIQYADFTIWQREQTRTPQAAAALRFWINQLRAPLPTLVIGGRP